MNQINDDNFYAGRRSERITFVINDTVLILKGPHSQKEAVVISIGKVEPEVQYLVELLDGSGDIQTEQKNMKLLVPSELSDDS